MFGCGLLQPMIVYLPTSRENIEKKYTAM